MAIYLLVSNNINVYRTLKKEKGSALYTGRIILNSEQILIHFEKFEV